MTEKKSKITRLKEDRNFMLVLLVALFIYGLATRIYSGYFCAACLILGPVLMLVVLYKQVRIFLIKRKEGR